MNEQQQPNRTREELEAENDFLKMKLMLEKGAVFGSSVPDEERDPEMDNKFLQYITALEAQMESNETIPIRQFLGFPEHFKPPAEVSDEEVDAAWEEAWSFMRERRIELAVCTPNITTKELYRFFYEEFLDADIDAIDVPGCVYTYHYDNFHPDPLYESSWVVEECLLFILGGREFPIECRLHWDPLQLNEHTGLTPEALVEKIRNFRSAFDDIEINDREEQSYTVHDNSIQAKGTYAVELHAGKEIGRVSGNWEMILLPDDVRQFWYVSKIVFEGLNF